MTENGTAWDKNICKKITDENVFYYRYRRKYENIAAPLKCSCMLAFNRQAAFYFDD